MYLINICGGVHFTLKFVFKTLPKTDLKKPFSIDHFEKMIARIY